METIKFHLHAYVHQVKVAWGGVEPPPRTPEQAVVVLITPVQRVLTGRQIAYERSPRMRRASWMSLGKMVTRLAWMAQRLVSSKRPTR